MEVAEASQVVAPWEVAADSQAVAVASPEVAHPAEVGSQEAGRPAGVVSQAVLQVADHANFACDRLLSSRTEHLNRGALFFASQRQEHLNPR